MSVLSQSNKTLTNGVGRCSVPMWMHGGPAGFCDEQLTTKWCEDIGGKDVRIPIGACLNVMTTMGNYSPPDVRLAMATFLRKIAGELEARRNH